MGETMRTAIAFFMGLVLAVAGCTQTEPYVPPPHTDSEEPAIPPAVLQKYEEISLLYQDSMGATLSLCENGPEARYAVSGSSGFYGTNVYYDMEGRILGQYDWDDIIEPNELPPPVDLSDYNCIALHSTGTAIDPAAQARSFS